MASLVTGLHKTLSLPKEGEEGGGREEESPIPLHNIVTHLLIQVHLCSSFNLVSLLPPLNDKKIKVKRQLSVKRAC